MSKELEKAAKKYSGIMYDREDYEEKYFNGQGCDKYDAFIAGAKHQEAINDSKIKDIAVKFFYHWWNTKGNNTEDGFDDWFKQFKQQKK